MAIKTALTPGSWVSLLTTTTDTGFYNKSNKPAFFVTGTTAGLNGDDGFPLPPFKAVKISAGIAVSFYAFDPGVVIVSTDL